MSDGYHTERFAQFRSARQALRAEAARVAAEERAEADRLRLEAAGQTDDRSSWAPSVTPMRIGHPGRSSATPTEMEDTPMATKTKNTDAATTSAVDLHALLVEQLAALGVKAEPRWSGGGAYASYMVEGKNVGYVFRQSNKATIKAKPGLTLADLPRGLKASFTSNEKESKVYAAIGTFGEKDLGKLAQALQLVASLQAEKRAAKAAAKAAPAPTTGTAEASA